MNIDSETLFQFCTPVILQTWPKLSSMHHVKSSILCILILHPEMSKKMNITLAGNIDNLNRVKVIRCDLT